MVTRTENHHCHSSARFSDNGGDSLELETFFDINEQVMQFLLSVVLGAGMGVVFDVFRVLRVVFPPAKKTGMVTVQDILFWALYAFVIFVYSVQYGRGQVRFFFFLGSLLGFALYILTVGNVIIGVIRKIASFVAKILRFVYSFTLKPIVKLLKILYQKQMGSFVKFHKFEIKSKINFSNLLKKRN